MTTSKDVFKGLMTLSEEFKTSGMAWSEKDDIIALGRARAQGKRIMNDIREFIKMSIDEQTALEQKAAKVEAVKVEPAKIVEPVKPIEEAKVTIAPKVETPVVTPPPQVKTTMVNTSQKK